MQLARFELVEYACAGCLHQIAVEKGRAQARLGEGFGYFFGLSLGFGEDQRGARVIEQQQVHQSFYARMIGHETSRVSNIRVLGLLARTAQLDLYGVFKKAFGKRRDGWWQRCGKQIGLRTLRSGGENLFHVFDEPHVEHFVALIEHHHGDLREIQGAAIQVIHHAARRAHHDASSVMQGLHLGRVRSATHKKGDVEAAIHAA